LEKENYIKKDSLLFPLDIFFSYSEIAGGLDGA